jgi:hypothetical protein
MFLDADPCLRRATKIVATEVVQVRQTVKHYYMRNEPAQAITHLHCIWYVAGLYLYRDTMILFQFFL